MNQRVIQVMKAIVLLLTWALLPGVGQSQPAIDQTSPGKVDGKAVFPQQDEFALINLGQLKKFCDATTSSDLAVEKRKIIQRARTIIENREIYSVTFNNPLSGPNRNNYYSTGPYWWPNPKTKNGLPYIRKDGQVNPERDKVSDRPQLSKFIASIETLSLAHCISREEVFAKYAIRLLEIWFIDQETRMKPNMENAQAIPGLHKGRGFGIIDTLNFAYLVDYITLLKRSRNWQADHTKFMDRWFSDFMNWLLSHKYGRDESDQKNNHGTAFDKQVIAIALYLKKYDWVRERLNSHTFKRIDSQIASNGVQPLETARTKSWYYTCRNLEIFYLLGLMAKNVDVDLFDYIGPQGGGLRKALDYALPFSISPREWPYKMNGEVQPEHLKFVMLVAARIYGDKKYRLIIDELHWDKVGARAYIRLPSPPVPESEGL